jgi:hypothetical protein
LDHVQAAECEKGYNHNKGYNKGYNHILLTPANNPHSEGFAVLEDR